MKFRPTSIDGLTLLEPIVFSDERGFLMELSKASTFRAAGLPSQFVQVNLSVSHRGVTRGLHFQVKPVEQGKFVTCLQGAIFDVAVDLRPDSPTFGKWESVELSGENKLALYVSEGFAHGFQALEDNTRVLYECTALYSQKHEDGIVYNDPDLSIPWPVPAPALSPKDSKLPTFEQWKRKNALI